MGLRTVARGESEDTPDLVRLEVELHELVEEVELVGHARLEREERVGTVLPAGGAGARQCGALDIVCRDRQDGGTHQTE